MPRVLQNDGGRARIIRLAEERRSIRADPRRHASARRAAPKGIIGGIDLQLVGVLKDKADGARQILARRCAGAIDQRKGVVALLGKLQRVREAVLHRAHIGKAAARVAHGEPRARRTLEEEQARIPLGGVGGFFFLGIDIVKDGFAVQRARAQKIGDFHRLIRVDVVVPRQAQTAQRIAAHVALVHRKNQPPVVAKRRIMDDGLNRRVLSICVHIRVLRESARSTPYAEKNQRKVNKKMSVFHQLTRSVLFSVLL